MYGFFTHALEEFIIEKFGPEKWQVIRMKAGFFEDFFEENLAYDDSMVYNIMDDACDNLCIKQEEFQEQFGETYFIHCLNSTHGKLLRALGGNLFDFLANIDSLHDHISVTYAGVKIPTFRVKPDSTRRVISVNYFSDRANLEYVTKGIIRVAAKELFGLDVITEVIHDNGTVKFLISTVNAEHAHLMFSKSIETSRDLIPQANVPKVSPFEFTKVFPFHMLFERSMKFIQVGATLKRILKDFVDKQSVITNYFSLSRPQISFEFESIYSRLNNYFVLSSRPNVVKPSPLTIHLQSSNNATPRATLRLKGQMIFLEEPDAMLFLCSPSVSNIEDMKHKGLCLSDIPIHDATRDLILLSENFQKELQLTHQLGIVNDHLQKIHTELEEEMHLYDRLLYSVLPPTIASYIRDAKQIPAEKFESVTLMFSGIVDFPSLCENLEPLKIVQILNDLYTKFDMLVDLMGVYVYKVETVGDKYMAVSGLPEKCQNHQQVICTLALDMLGITRLVKVDGRDIQVTFGVHSGEVVAGVIGQRLPRYCLFGNAVNLTSRTESTGLKGKINVTEETYKLLSEDEIQTYSYVFTKRGMVNMKGKSEPMFTYVLSRAEKRSYPEMNFLLNSYDLMDGAEGPVQIQGGDFTLNRTRAQSSSGGGTWRSQSASTHASRFTTPSHSKNVSRFATPLRSRCNSGISLATSPYLPSSSSISGQSRFEPVHVMIGGNGLDLVEEKSPPGTPAAASEKSSSLKRKQKSNRK